MHVAIIPDGLRRWARLHGITYDRSYSLMCEKLVEYTRQAFDMGVESVTLYLSSAINFTRTNEDIEAGCMAEHIMCSRLLPSLVDIYNARVIIAGNTHLQPSYLVESAKYLLNITASNSARTLYLCMAYNPIEEIRHAIKTFVDSGNLNIDKQNIMDLLWVPEAVDILIRTGKGQLATNLLPLQCAGHAKHYVFDELFLDTSTEDIRKVLVHHRENLANEIQSVDDLNVISGSAE